MSAQLKMPKYPKDVLKVKNSGSFGQLKCFSVTKRLYCLLTEKYKKIEKESNGWNQ